MFFITRVYQSVYWELATIDWARGAEENTYVFGNARP